MSNYNNNKGTNEMKCLKNYKLDPKNAFMNTFKIP